MAMTTSVEELMKVYDSLFRQCLNLSQSFMAPGGIDTESLDSGAAGESIALSRSLLQALSAASTSSLSYGYSVQSIIYKFQAALVALNFSGHNAELKHALLIDELRGFLREIGDSASREGRHFQHQLAMITEQLAQAEAKANDLRSNNSKADNSKADNSQSTASN